jgi:hypothetical protein
LLRVVNSRWGAGQLRWPFLSERSVGIRSCLPPSGFAVCNDRCALQCSAVEASRNLAWCC